MTTCERDGQRENPISRRPTIASRCGSIGAAPQSTCAWLFDEGEGQPRTYTGPCSEEVRIRLVYGKAISHHGRCVATGRAAAARQQRRSWCAIS